MFRYLLIYMACLLFAFSVKAQGISNDTIPKEVLMLDGKPMTEKQIQRYHKQLHKDSIRANKRIWWSILGGPSYTPEASFGVGGAVLASFRLNKNDTISQRSFIPAGFNITLNGTFVFAGAGTLFFNENRFRIYISYGYRNEPSHYFGKGYETIEQIEKSDSTTKFHKSSFQLYPRFVWEVRPHLYTGPLFDINFSKSDDINPVMAEDPYFNKFKRDYVNIGVGGLFFNENRFRIYISYGYRNEPSHYFGKGYETIEQIEKSDSTTKFHKSSFQLYPRFVWEVRPHLYTGPLFDINFSKSDDINPVMAEDPYFNKFKRDYVNIGVGGLIQYDTRNDVATPSSGMLLSAIAKVYGKYLGGAYNYEMFELEYRQFQQVFRPRSTLAWIAKTQIGVGNVPFTELPSFGSPFDLRGYYWGKYRDKTMAYGILEYRHMFGSVEKYKSGNFWAKCGFVGWVGTGTIGNAPIVDWNKWKFNYGVGLRIQMQPGKNFRLDVGKDPNQKGMAVYMNMTEAF